MGVFWGSENLLKILLRKTKSTGVIYLGYKFINLCRNNFLEESVEKTIRKAVLVRRVDIFPIGLFLFCDLDR